MKIPEVNDFDSNEDFYLYTSGNPNKDENDMDEELDDAEYDNYSLLYLRGGLWVLDKSL